MATTKVTRNFQVTIPADVRKILHIKILGHSLLGSQDLRASSQIPSYCAIKDNCFILHLNFDFMPSYSLVLYLHTITRSTKYAQTLLTGIRLDKGRWRERLKDFTKRNEKSWPIVF